MINFMIIVVKMMMMMIIHLPASLLYEHPTIRAAGHMGREKSTQPELQERHLMIIMMIIIMIMTIMIEMLNQTYSWEKNPENRQ